MLNPSEMPGSMKLLSVVLALGLVAAVAVTIALTTDLANAQSGGANIVYEDPQPCSAETYIPDPAEVIDSGHYALFDAFWDNQADAPKLSGNFCPPAVVHQTVGGGRDQPDREVATRHASNIDISRTVFAVTDADLFTARDTNPDRNDRVLNLSNHHHLVNAGLLSDGDTLYWIRPEGESVSALQLGFSTMLLRHRDWFKDNDRNGVSDGPPVQYEFEAVDAPLGGKLFAFSYERGLVWDSLDIDTNVIEMEVGKYDHLHWGFTKPGVYRIQVHFKAHVRQVAPAGWDAHTNGEWEQVGPGRVLTSEAHLYTFHIGLEDDLSVDIVVADETPGDDTTTATDGTVGFAVQATNAGPDTVHDALVQIRLPYGLSYNVGGTATPAVSVGCGVISWDPGDLASSGVATLTFEANVVGENPGSRQEVVAEIRDLNAGDLDVDTSNNRATVAALLDTSRVRSPRFKLGSLLIPENAVAGTHAGDPLPVSNLDGRPLRYSLSGICSNWFRIDGNGQITLADNVSLNYTEQWAIPLKVTVSDGLDADGNTEARPVVDLRADVLIHVIDTPDDDPSDSDND